MTPQLIKLILITTTMKFALCQTQVPIVQTSHGAVMGVYTAHEDGNFFYYKGIPYARPPKNNAFGDPVDIPPWNGVFGAFQEIAACPQREEYNATLVGDVDCLGMNIIVPASRDPEQTLAVYVYIFGGAFRFGYAGASIWGPEKLAHHDVVVVNINYRVGPYGNLCLGSDLVPGNAGYKDIVKALRWIQNNIAAFGGDPSQVTIGGCSSGSMIVEWLITSPIAHGLFKRGIMESGSITRAENTGVDYHHDEVLVLSHFFGYRGGSVNAAIRFLTEIEPRNIVIATEIFDYSFVICVEPHIEGVEALFTDIPAKIFESGNFSQVDVLLGITSNEMPYALNMNDESLVIDEYDSGLFRVPLSEFRLTGSEYEDKLPEIMRRFYIGGQSMTKNVVNQLSELKSDYSFNYPSWRSAMTYLKYTKTAYFYQFAYSGGRNFIKSRQHLSFPGAMHADELGYIFNQIFWGDINEEDKLISDRITTMWTNFVKYGNPTPDITELLPVQWPPLRERNYTYLVIDKHMEAKTDLMKERMALWDLLYLNYRKLDYDDRKMRFDYYM